MQAPMPDTFLADTTVQSKRQRVRRRKKAGRWVRVQSVDQRSAEEPSQRFQLGVGAPASAAQLSKLLGQRRSSSELSERNIIQRRFELGATAVRCRIQEAISCAEHSIIEQRRIAALHLGRKLRSRPAISALVNKGLIRASPQGSASSSELRAGHGPEGRQQLLRGFRNRRTRQQLVHLGIARPLQSENADAVYERALSPSSAKAAADLDKALASRPSRQDLVSTGVMPKDGVVWAPLEADWNSATGTSFPPPSARNCHTFDFVRGQILLVAGHSMLDSSTVPYCLDLRNAKWMPMFPQAEAQHPRLSSSSLHAVLHNQSESGASRAESAAACAPVTPLIQQAAVSSSGPCARYAHATTECCGTLLLMGGYGKHQWLNDVWSFDCARQQWCAAAVMNGSASTEVGSSSLHWSSLRSHSSDLSEIPAPRAAHTLTAIPVQSWARAIESARHLSAKSLHGETSTEHNSEEACAVLFGGNDKNGLFNDVWLLRQLPSSAVGSGVLPAAQLLWLKPIVVGDTPTPRAGHTAVLFGASMIVFGGSRGWGTEAFNDLHVLDVGNIRPWLQPSVASLHEDPVQDADSLVFWYRPSVSGQAPAARAGHTAALIGNNMLVFGGADSVQCFDDLHVLQCSTFSWSTPMVSGSPPKARSGSAAVAVGDTMVIFGGATFTGELLNDVHLLETDFLGRTAELVPSAVLPQGLHKPLPKSSPRRVPDTAKGIETPLDTEVSGATQATASGKQSIHLSLVMNAYSNWKAELAGIKALMAAEEQAQQARFEQLIAEASALG